MGCSLSDAETFRTMPAPPSCPLAARQQEATPSALLVTWLPPAADHGSAVTAYQLEYGAAVGGSGSRTALAAWRLAYQGGDTLARLEGLDAGSRYLVRLRACNACGWGSWSEVLPCSTAPDRPGPPRGLVAKAVGTTVRVSWGDTGEDNGASIQSYELQMAAGGTAMLSANMGESTTAAAFATVFSGLATGHRVQQLQPSSTYQFRMRAVNAGASVGGWSRFGLSSAGGWLSQPDCPGCPAVSLTHLACTVLCCVLLLQWVRAPSATWWWCRPAARRPRRRRRCRWA